LDRRHNEDTQRRAIQNVTMIFMIAAIIAIITITLGTNESNATNIATESKGLDGNRRRAR
jgi:hypothetical protein